jgi:hypothetical protein
MAQSHPGEERLDRRGPIGVISNATWSFLKKISRMSREIVLVNRAPVLTLWAAVVAERLGYDHDAALSFGKAVAGLNAQSKGRSLGIYKPAERPEGAPPKKAGLGEEFWVEILGRRVPAKSTDEGVRAVFKDKPVASEGVERYLEEKFGPARQAVSKAMRALADSFRPAELAAVAYSLYEKFRPEIPPGVRGWGAKGELDLGRIISLKARS